jgi:hypothetical protein
VDENPANVSGSGLIKDATESLPLRANHIPGIDGIDLRPVVWA